MIAISGLLVCGCTEAARKHNAAAGSKAGEKAETKTAAEQPKHEE
jgi:hypothetical protein